jgi:hypothetical protein
MVDGRCPGPDEEKEVIPSQQSSQIGSIIAGNLHHGAARANTLPAADELNRFALGRQSGKLSRTQATVQKLRFCLNESSLDVSGPGLNPAGRDWFGRIAIRGSGGRDDFNDAV